MSKLIMNIHCANYRKTAICFFFALAMSCFELSFSQNEKYNLMLLDTTGTNLRFELVVMNIDLTGATKVVVSRITDSGKEITMKEIRVNPVGDYFLLNENGNQTLIKNTLQTSLIISKRNFNLTRHMYYKIYVGGDPSKYSIVLPNK